MKITHEQANSMLAEKAMGWELKVHSRRPDAWYKIGNDHWEYLSFPAPCGYHMDEQWNPTTNPAQRDMCLEAYCKKHNACWRASNAGRIFWYQINHGLGVENTDQNIAACEALCSAISGEPVTIKEV